ncbi:MAG: PAS domain S-box protein [Deltaproteobacteria bacterium]|nr:PAS domain S-box protein [Deltaproteobacteria bacterium]
MGKTFAKKKQHPPSSSKDLLSGIKAIQKSLGDLLQSIPGCPDEVQRDLFVLSENLQTQGTFLSEKFAKCQELEKQAQEALQESEQRYRTIFETAGIAMAVIEEDGILSQVNNKFAKMAGYGKNELEGKKTWRDFIVKEDLKRLQEYHRLRTIDPKAAPRSYEAGGLDKSGNRKNLLITIERFSGTQQRIASFMDLTELKKTQDSIKKMADGYRTLFNLANDAIFVLHPDTMVILDVNQKTCELYGFTLEEARFLKMEDVSDNSPPYTPTSALTWFKKALTGIPGVVEWRAKDKSGRLFWVEVSMKRITILGDERILVTVRDITKRKQLEEQFRQAQKMEAIGRLTAGVAHDFNNLLTVIAGYSGVMLSNLKKNDPLFQPLMEIKKAGEKASLLTRQLLAFGRKQVLAPRIIDLNRIVENIGKMIGRIIGEAVELEVLLDPNPLPVYIDIGQMEQVIMNLAINARDAMPRGGKLLMRTAAKEISSNTFCKTCGNFFHPGTHVTMSIKDTGIGIEPHIQPLVFEPFFTTKQEGKGSGLGLSMIQGIIHQSGGHIDFFSQPNQGTIFIIYLPKRDRKRAVLSNDPEKR